MKSVEHVMCKGCGKRGFRSEHAADKALGRAKAKRNRVGDSLGTRRGLKTENRYYECEYGLFHLTSESRESYRSRVAA